MEAWNDYNLQIIGSKELLEKLAKHSRKHAAKEWKEVEMAQEGGESNFNNYKIDLNENNCIGVFKKCLLQEIRSEHWVVTKKNSTFQHQFWCSQKKIQHHNVSHSILRIKLRAVNLPKNESSNGKKNFKFIIRNQLVSTFQSKQLLSNRFSTDYWSRRLIKA